MNSRITCDEDGWMLDVNKDPPYPTFPHLFPPSAIEWVWINGKGAEISYVGFGPKGKNITSKENTFFYKNYTDMTPAANVGFNLTYVCPQGLVFRHDWFATPFVMITCQGS